MRLALKVVFATVLGTMIVLALFGWLRARQEIAVFDADMRRDHRLIGTTLATCVSRTWSSVGARAALELIELANANRPGLRINWVQEPTPESLAEDVLVTLVPVHEAGQRLGAIEISESLETRDAYVRASVGNTILATLATVVVSGVVALVVGVWLVGKPLGLLAAKALRIGQGDLSGPLRLKQRDEVGQLAQAVNAMCERLAEANARSAAETSARIKAMEQLRHADRLITVGRLAAGIAHELGTPLNVIIGRVKMLRRGAVTPEAVEDYLTSVAEQADRMTAIIGQLLDFARRRGPKIGEVDLQYLARSIVKLLEPIARKHDVRLEVSSDTRALARGDIMQLEQVLSNLVVNAIHACKGGGLVTVSAGLTEVAGPAPERNAYLRVEDDGEGMDKEIQDRIFEPFFTTKDIGQGTGLGLSVAHGIVQEHGGSILVETQLGRGSSFSVLLPVGNA